MRVARTRLGARAEAAAVALGTFDGVHLGHRRVIEAALAAGPTPTVVTFDPHPRRVLGYAVEQLCTLERRLELLRRPRRRGHARGRVHPRHQRIEAKDFARAVPARDRRREWWSQARTSGSVTSGEAISTCCAVSASTCDRCRCSRACPRRPIRHLLHEGEWTRPLRCWAGHPRSTGRWSRGTRAGARSAFPPRIVAADPVLLVPLHGIYAGFAAGPKYKGAEQRSRSASTRTTAATSCGSRPSCSGSPAISTASAWSSSCGGASATSEVFDSEQALIDQIARDVDATSGPSGRASRRAAPSHWRFAASLRSTGR